MKSFLPSVTGLMLILSLNSNAADKSNQHSNHSQFTPVVMISSYMFAANGNLADGNRIVFDEQFSNLVDIDDSWKMTNPGENFGLLRDGQTLAVECRQPVQAGDTMYYKSTNFATQTYKYMMIPQNLPASVVNCELVDNYLGLRTTLSLTDTNRVNIPFTTDPASKAANRLKLVFTSKLFSTLPISFTGFTASRNADKTVSLFCKATNEAGLTGYTAESSTDGQSFKPVCTWDAKNNTAVEAAYTARDIHAASCETFYRVKATERSGTVHYSGVVKVDALRNTGGVAILQNPVLNRNLQVQFSNQPAGVYQVDLTDMSGRIVQTAQVKLSTGSDRKSISLGSSVNPGLYQLSVHAAGKLISTNAVIVQ